MRENGQSANRKLHDSSVVSIIVESHSSIAVNSNRSKYRIICKRQPNLTLKEETNRLTLPVQTQGQEIDKTNNR